MHMYNRQCYARIIDYEIEPVCFCCLVCVLIWCLFLFIVTTGINDILA